VDPEEEAQLETAARPAGIFAGGEGKDFRVLAAGTAQNVGGLVVFVIGTFAANILISRAFGGGATGAVALGIVTIATWRSTWARGTSAGSAASSAEPPRWRA